MSDNKLLKLFLEDLQKLSEKKKSKPDFLDLDGDGDKKEPMKKAAQDKKKSNLKEEDGTIVCGACGHKNIIDKSPSELKICQSPDCDEPLDVLDEKRKQLDRARRAYQRGDVAAAARIRRNMEKKERSKKGYRNIPRSDTGIYTESKQINELNELINDMIEEQLLDEMLNDLERHLDEKRKRKKKKKKKGGGLSAAEKKSLYLQVLGKACQHTSGHMRV